MVPIVAGLVVVVGAPVDPEAPRSAAAAGPPRRRLIPLGSNPCSIRPGPPCSGIDPGVSRCGYGVVRRDGAQFRAVAYGVIRTPPSEELPDRLGRARRRARRARWREYPPIGAGGRAGAVPGEHAHRDVGRAGERARARRSPARAGVPVVHYSPNEVKLAVAGDGGAGKYEVQTMVMRLLQLAELPDPPDAADALALALCHWWRAPLAASATATRASRRLDEAIAAALARRGAMIGSVRGTVIERTPSGEVLVEVGGVGYRVLVPLGALPALHPGDAAFLFTHLHVREDAMVLYGFPTPRRARHVRGAHRRHRRRPEARAGDAVGALADARCGARSLEDDLAALTMVPGVGKRTAQRLLVELKARLAVPELDLTEARRRAGAAGRGARRARRASATRPTRCATSSAQLPEDGSVEDLLRDALKLLAVTHA